MAEEIALALINESIQKVSVFSIINSSIDFLKILVGGLFGLALISFLVSVWFSVKNRRTLKEIKSELRHMSHRIDNLEKKAKKK